MNLVKARWLNPRVDTATLWGPPTEMDRVNLSRLASTVLLIAAAAACTTPSMRARRAGASVTVAPPPKSDVWKAVASAADEDRIDRLGLAWQAGLSEASPKFSSAIKESGDLLKPLARLPRPAPTPGSYNCRLVTLGSNDKKTPPYQKFNPFFCYVLADDQGQLTIVKQTGSQRPAGALWEDDDPKRMIFLGSLALGDEKEPLAYGDDPTRDMAGVFERIAPFRWRLVIPWPRSGAKIEVFELTPVANQPDG